MKPIIEVSHLSKKYKYGESQPYYTLRDTLMGLTKSPFGKGKKKLILGKDEFWALNGVSFKLNPGEILGVIGPNGSGKSTLLKVLSQITPPTKGSAVLRGRVGSLLEVGTGFQQELTGRENIYLNGAILGMKRREIDKKFDEIVAFSGVEFFLDTPVKHYSSGMYMRLAFAVAAHLDSEILLVDEVLAVGDAEFQKKCLGKINEVARSGRTVIFVSHNMSAITSLCTKAIVLKSGSIVFKGEPSKAALYYLTNKKISQGAINFSDRRKKIGDDYATLISGSVRNSKGKSISEVGINESFRVCMEFEILKKTKRKFLPQIDFFTSGLHVFSEYYQDPLELVPGYYHVEFEVPPNFLNDLSYFVGFGLTTTEITSIVHFYEQDALTFNVRDSFINTPGPRRAGYNGEVAGLIRPQLNWKVKKI